VSNSGVITTLSNSGVISGGNGGGASTGGAGGAGVSNAWTITTLSNSGAIGGGNGGAPGAGGAGVSNSGTITTLTSSGTISGGAGGEFGGAGVSNARGGTITTLSNSGTIYGDAGGPGGAGVSNAGTITTLTNSGTVSGGAGGAGIWNAGAIRSFDNAGTIEGGIGSPNGAAGDAIYSAGKHASIGSITNTGRIIGNVQIDNQASVTVTGGTGKTFGSWTRGVITIGNGNLTFAAGNTALGDDIAVNDGKGTVFNNDPLMIAAPLTITGNFTQTAAGALDLDFAGVASGEYGALTIGSLATLDGALGIDLIGSFTLAKGDSFDILNFSGHTGNFDQLALDGAACSMAGGPDSWSCGGGVRLREVIDGTSLGLFVAQAPAVFGPAAISSIPEPSTWAMMLLGFLGLGGVGLKGRRKVSPI